MAARTCLKMCGEKLSKSEKRALRKQNYKLHSLLKHNAELYVSEEPTKHLLVNNGGLMNGVNRSQIESLFEVFGLIERVTMLPQRSYSFVTFTNVDEAKRAMREISGKKLDSGLDFSKAGVILYLSYLKQVPHVEQLTKTTPPGLILIEDFVDEQQEKELLDAFEWDNESEINQIDIDSSEAESVQKQLKHRKVKHYGYEFLYGTNDIDASKPLPGGIPKVCHRMLQNMVSNGYIKDIPDQLTVNHYSPGQGIPPHIDTHSAFEDGIVSLSLGAKIVMEFRHPDSRHIPVLLPQRSLLIMTGESRYQWTHGITPRKYDITSEKTQPEPGIENKDGVTAGVTQFQREKRISLTFRKIKQTPCTCNYPKQCDSQDYTDHLSPNSYSLPMTKGDAERLESNHVHDVYERIAEHFSDTRHSPWPRIASFLRDLPMGSLVADVGCGNGKYLGINQDIYKSGSDRSFNLAAIAKERGHSVIVCDVLDLPYRSEAFDVCICIAVLHHLSTTERRLEGLRELVRIVRTGGLVLVYVWAMEQNLEKIKKKDLREVEFTAKENMNEVKQSTNDMHQNTIEPQQNAIETQQITVETQQNAIEIQQKMNESEHSPTADSFVSSSKHIGRDGKHYKEDKKEPESHSVQVNMKREVFEQQDLFVPWKYRGGKQDKASKDAEHNTKTISADHGATNVYHRFYHVFKEGELLELCGRLDNVVLKTTYYDRGNWCVVLEKLK